VNKSKIKGTSAETAVVNWLVSKGRKHVERRALAGLLDRGDIAGIPSVVIEVKNCKAISLSAWLKELEVEMINDKAETGVVIHKKSGTQDVGKWYATMPVSIWYALLNDAGY
jgi:hypothetical protein